MFVANISSRVKGDGPTILFRWRLDSVSVRDSELTNSLLTAPSPIASSFRSLASTSTFCG